MKLVVLADLQKINPTITFEDIKHYLEIINGPNYASGKQTDSMAVWEGYQKVRDARRALLEQQRKGLAQ
jgi:hypothetical protein